MASFRCCVLSLLALLVAAAVLHSYFAAREVDSVFKRRQVPFWHFPPKPELRTQADVRLHAVTCLHYTTTDEVVISTQWNHESAVVPPRDGVHPFPSAFYDGVIYAITAWHQMGRWQSAKRNAEQNAELKEEIDRMWPPPDQVVPYSSIDLDTDFEERGFALHFDLPTREVELAVLALGRVFGQVQVTKWWGHAWGPHHRKHVTVMQGLVPVASGVRAVKAEATLRVVVPRAREIRFFAARWKEGAEEEEEAPQEGTDL